MLKAEPSSGLVLGVTGLTLVLLMSVRIALLTGGVVSLLLANVNTARLRSMLLSTMYWSKLVPAPVVVLFSAEGPARIALMVPDWRSKGFKLCTLPPAFELITVPPTSRNRFTLAV